MRLARLSYRPRKLLHLILRSAHRSRACPTSAIKKRRNRQQPISMRASRRMATGTAAQAAILRDAPQRCGAPQDEVRDLRRAPGRYETSSSPPQINLDHPVVLRDLINRALRDDRTLVQ